MTKTEFIEKYGEERWQEQKRKKAEYDKKRNAERAEIRKIESKVYYEKNKERIHLKYINNKDKKKEYNKKYNETHKNEISANKKEYYANNKDKKGEYNKSYRETKNGRIKYMIAYYKKEDIKNDREGFNLTSNWILDNIFNSSCIYCGDDNWRHLGCDRVDNTKPHSPDNIVCSCGICNVERQNKRMSVEEFVEYRKTNPSDVYFKLPQQIVEINGKKVIKKVG